METRVLKEKKVQRETLDLKDRRELKACKGFRDLKVQKAVMVTKDIQE